MVRKRSPFSESAAFSAKAATVCIQAVSSRTSGLSSYATVVSSGAAVGRLKISARGVADIVSQQNFRL